MIRLQQNYIAPKPKRQSKTGKKKPRRPFDKLEDFTITGLWNSGVRSFAKIGRSVGRDRTSVRDRLEKLEVLPKSMWIREYYHRDLKQVSPGTPK